MRWTAFVFLVACGNDRVPGGGESVADAPPPPGTPLVAITAPAANSAFYVTETVTIAWTVDDASAALACDVDANDGAVAISGDVASAAGQPTTTAWSLASVTPAEYSVRVTCTDSDGLTGIAHSGTFVVSPPPQQVSFASQIQPILSTCTNAQCHDANQPQASLNLLTGSSYAELVNVASEQCASVSLVKPGAPNESYLVHKLQGSGASCYVGTRMPKLASALSTEQMQLFRDWIANGAPNN
jgi:hypothetical protein